MDRITSMKAKLKPRQVRIARKMLAEGKRQVDVAARLRVSQSAISMLQRRVTYRKVA